MHYNISINFIEICEDHEEFPLLSGKKRKKEITYQKYKYLTFIKII